MSRPESVSSSRASSGSSMAIWKISFFFFSPPENPSFTARFESLAVSSTTFFFSSIRARNSAADKGGWLRYLRMSFKAVRMKLLMLTPWISTGYWNPRKIPSRALSSTGIASRFFPLYRISPSVTLKRSRPAITAAKVLFPLPFGPIKACFSPLSIVRSTPFKISFPSMETCKFLISSNELMLCYT